MTGRWWRAYDEALHDPKLLGLSDRLFRFWFCLLCVFSKNDGKLPDIGTVSTELRVTPLKVQLILSALISSGLLDDDKGLITPHNWTKRQYKTDVTDPTNAARQRRYRQRYATVTRPLRTNDQSTETETERRRKKEKVSKEKESGGREERAKGSRLATDWQPSEADINAAGMIGLRLYEIDAEIPKFIDYWHARAGPGAVKRDWSATWRNWCRKAFEQQKPGGSSNGRQLQDDRLSVGKAAERLMAATGPDVRTPPRPSLVRPASETDRRLLPKG